MRRLVVVLLSTLLLYLLCYWATPLYGSLAGGLPIHRWACALVLECMFLVSGLLSGVAFERLGESGDWVEPLKVCGFFMAVFFLPIALHQLVEALPIRFVDHNALMVEKYRYILALAVLVATIVHKKIEINRWNRAQRRADSNIIILLGPF